jgi:hypothetical protein
MEEVKITEKYIKTHLKKLLKELNKNEKTYKNQLKKQAITGIKINRGISIVDLSD